VWPEPVISLSVVVALLSDRLWGEASRGHPLVTFGQLAKWVEGHARQMTPASHEPGVRSGRLACYHRLAGGVSWLLLVIIPTTLLAVLLGLANDMAAGFAAVLVLYFCIGGRSLAEHARAVMQPLDGGDLVTARERLGRIVSRDTANLDEQSVTNASIESVLENGSDALLAPIFWFAVAGAPGALCYRLANTLDAMWGYRNPRYQYFGWTAARMDDWFNWLPARCCALAYALAGHCRTALRCWHVQAPGCESPNAGPVMAAGAGALGLRLGGPATYDNEPRWRPQLGEGKLARPQDIERTLRLLWHATGIWLLVIVACEVMTWA